MTASELSWLTARPIAHRGLHDRSAGSVENSRSAFAAAIAGRYAIECDVQVTRDGEAMVFHDDHLGRLTGSPGLVRETTAAQMKALTLKDSSDRIQTLTELLLQISGRVPLVIEIKSQWDGNLSLVDRVLASLAEYEGPFAIMSFDPDIVDRVRQMSPRTPRGIVADRATDDDYNTLPMARRVELRTLSHLDRTAPHFMSLYFRDLPWAPVSAYRQRGRPVISWTIRSRDEASDALRHSDQITFEGFAA